MRETESEILTARNQALDNRYCATEILKSERGSQCGLWQQYKAIQHITSACPILAKEYYVRCLNRACAQLRFNV
jgi:hypothetical protein